MLNAWLSAHHLVTEHTASDSLEETFDLSIVDGPSLKRHLDGLQTRREQERPGILPLLLLTRRHDIWAAMPQLWPIVDDVVEIPVSKLELQTRVEILLRARRMSQELRVRNQDLEAFMQAMSHDLKASIRTVTMFAETLVESRGKELDEQAKEDLQRIQWAADEMRELIDSLLNFSRLGRGEVRYEPIDLRSYMEACVRSLEVDIRNRNANVQIKGRSRTVQADPTLMKIALTNLLSNAIKFVPEGVQPEVTVSTSVRKDSWRIQVEDNGVGIAKEDQQRIFAPFVRLYPEEQFPGVGLGLPSVRKAVELMGGRVGVSSVPGQGSRFWIEFTM